MSEPLVRVTGLSKSFGALPVLRCVNTAVYPGRVTALVGPNSAGKTTLIKTLLGLTRPDAGRIAIRGMDINGDPQYRSRIGYMPQIARYPDNLTAMELISMLKDLRGPGTPLDLDLVDALALDPVLEKPLRLLSGGTRQKVNAVMAFLFSPELLVLDEPTAGLDPVSSGVLKDKILSERSGGRTFLLSSHIMNELEELADDVTLLLEGQIVFAGTLDELKRITNQGTLERAIATMMRRGLIPVAA
jgi:Cu-processing system ATP-binding protein